MAATNCIDTVTQVSPPSAVGRAERVDTRARIGYNRSNCSPPSGSSGPNWRGLSIASEPDNACTRGHHG